MKKGNSSSLPGVASVARGSNESIDQSLIRVSATHQDIICGRGLHITNHVGNTKLHRIVTRHRQSYLEASRNEKAVIIRRIVKEIKSTGSKFIRRVEGDRGDEWVEVDDETAYNKVGHALRRKQNPQKQESLSRPNSEIEGQQQNQGQSVLASPLDTATSAATSRNATLLHHAAPRLTSSLSSIAPSQPFLLGNPLHSAGPRLGPSSLSHPNSLITAANMGYGALLNNVYFANTFNSILAIMIQSSTTHQHQHQHQPVEQPRVRIRHDDQGEQGSSSGSSEEESSEGEESSSEDSSSSDDASPRRGGGGR